MAALLGMSTLSDRAFYRTPDRPPLLPELCLNGHLFEFCIEQRHDFIRRLTRRRVCQSGISSRGIRQRAMDRV